jgi:hypothetical protein
MTAQSRSKQATRAAKSLKTTKGGGRGRAPVRSTRDLPILAIAVGAILLVLFIGLIVYGVINSRNSSGVPVVHGSTTNIPCDSLEHTQVHYHVGLQIVVNGTLHPINASGQSIAIQGGETAPICYYWLHVHGANQDTIHIESPVDTANGKAVTFTLGDWFKVWDAYNTYNGMPHELLTPTQVSTYTLTTGEDIKVYVDLNDGKGPQLYTGNPNNIILKAHEVITIVIGPPDLQPSDGRFPQFTFAPGL